jgi:NADPH-dependent F420 reductase
VWIGSRDRERARQAATRIAGIVAQGRVEGALNAEAAGQAEFVVLAVPVAAQVETLQSAREAFSERTVLVDATVPLDRALGGRLGALVSLWEGSAGQRAARHAGGFAKVTAAFHSLSAVSLADLATPLDSDVLVVGDDASARARVSAWVKKIPGARPVDGGRLENARYAEHLAALLISLNLQHRVRSSGIRFTGLPGLEDLA